MCTSGVSPHHILLAFQQGADGVLMGGCHSGECHYIDGNLTAEKRIKLLKPLLGFIGIEEERLRVKWVSSAQAPEFVEEVNDFVGTLRELGPSPLNLNEKKIACSNK